MKGRRGKAMALADSEDIVPLSTRVLISYFKVSYNILRQPDGGFNRHLAESLDQHVPANATPVDGVASIDVMIDNLVGLWCRIFWSNLPCPAIDVSGGDVGIGGHKPLLIYFHGGSFVHLSANSAIYDSMCRHLARLCGVVVVSVNFRRAPEHKCPAAYDDGLSVVRWAKSALGLALLAPLGCNPATRCFLAGDSSGGNIAHHVAAQALVTPGLAIAGIVLLMPMFGGRHRTAAEHLLDGKYFVTVKDRDWYWRAFLPVGSNRDHPACDPFSRSVDGFPAIADIRRLPPSLVVVGGLDLLQDWQLKYVHGLKHAGHPVQLLFMEHATMGFFLLPNSEFFYTLVQKLRHFLNEPH